MTRIIYLGEPWKHPAVEKACKILLHIITLCDALFLFIQGCDSDESIQFLPEQEFFHYNAVWDTCHNSITHLLHGPFVSPFSNYE